MGDLLTTIDVVIFFGSLLAVMGIGLWAGRKEDTSTDYYLAGKSTRWWGVAGSIFGSNVSWAVFALPAIKGSRAEGKPLPLIGQDRIWAGLLAAAAVFMMYYFY